jgi:transposase
MTSLAERVSEAVMPRSYPPEFRRKVLDLVASGRKVAEAARHPAADEFN